MILYPLRLDLPSKNCTQPGITCSDRMSSELDHDNYDLDELCIL